MAQFLYEKVRFPPPAADKFDEIGKIGINERRAEILLAGAVGPAAIIAIHFG
jgi:hypothetical protein